MNQNKIPEKYFENSKELIVASSKYCGVRSISANNLYEIFKTDVLKEIYNKSAELKHYSVDGFNHYFIIKKLEWDTEFFQRPMYRMLAILYDHENYSVLEKAIGIFKEGFLKETKQGAYCYMELPSEANILLQTLTSNGFRIIESRLHHYLKDIQTFNHKRFSVREADVDDVKNLSTVASNTRNKYDRFHSDIYISDELADKYLGKFAQETVNGFADMVIVPNESGIEPNALFAVNLLKDDWSLLGANISQLVLAAVDPNTCRGWYEKLLSEICYYLKENGAEYLITNTQTTNKAPIHVNEKFGFKYSHTTHILTISNV
jgi:dTDP-4-amino-4,6-dideoxy-D-galactose acyltransferase